MDGNFMRLHSCAAPCSRPPVTPTWCTRLALDSHRADLLSKMVLGGSPAPGSGPWDSSPAATSALELTSKGVWPWTSPGLHTTTCTRGAGPDARRPTREPWCAVPHPSTSASVTSSGSQATRENCRPPFLNAAFSSATCARGCRGPGSKGQVKERGGEVGPTPASCRAAEGWRS